MTINKSGNYLDRLNDMQREAALHTEGPLLILAGAGSGKTSTMTCRIVRLIEQGVNPYNILAVTFTNKAANEMRERVEELIEELPELMMSPADIFGMWIQTFHSACLRILRVNAERLGYERNFAVYDPQDQKTVIKNIAKEQNIDDKKFTPSYLLSIISDCKNKGQNADDYINAHGEDFRTKIIYSVYRAYENTLRRNNAMDFDDLLLNTVKLLSENEDVLARYQSRFRYIMVDEYQDTNYIQYKFVHMLASGHSNICVVGDDDQCIYEWRGADIRNILDFERDFKGTKVIKLEQNYRSYGNILDAAHSVISHNKGRKAKKLWTAKDAGDKVIYYRADSEKDEANYIAREIDRFVGRVLTVGYEGGEAAEGRKLEYRDFAVLYRTNAQSRNFEDAFSRNDIPYRVLGGLRYYDRKEIKDMMAYMRLAHNSADDLSLMRIINEPKRGIGDKTVEKLRALANVRGQSMFDALCDEDVLYALPAKAVSSVAEMLKVIKECADEKENLRVSDIYDTLLVRTGYLKSLEDQNTVEADGRIENLLEFKSVISEYEKDDPELSLEEFMEKVALISDVDNHDADENAVVLMTMHSAKGLEFPVVFLPGMEDGLFPGWRAYEKPDGLEEERRLCYVGMTRAKDRLYLTSAAVRTLYGKTDYTRESQFLREVDKKLIDGDAIYDGRKRGGFDGFGGLDGYTNSIPAAKPFDSLKYAKQEVKSRGSGGAEVSYMQGDEVSHGKFGHGLVIESDDRTVTVMFDSVGLKKLAKDIAPLKKL
ncbi:MAG: UvrD-helicase domain-containing protein [Firmicutes bacterium]|nr:UvrD-helicase domain-containing protein [Bacillota bacterium]